MGILGKIKLLLALRKAGKNMDLSTIKSGICSTEFWTVVITAALVAASQALGWSISEETISNIVQLVLTYVGGRSAVKAIGALANRREDKGTRNAAPKK